MSDRIVSHSTVASYHLVGALTVLSNEIASSRPGKLTARSIVPIEVAVDASLRSVREILAEIAPRSESYPRGRWRGGIDRGGYEPLLRCIVAYATLLDLVSQVVGRETGLAWGQHLFCDADFHLVDFDPIPFPVPEAGIPLIAADVCADLAQAFEDMSSKAVGDLDAQLVALTGALTDISEWLGCTSAHVARIVAGSTMSLLGPAGAAAALGVPLSDLDTLAKERKVLRVPLWSGEFGYPEFQFDRSSSSVKPNVTAVLSNTSFDVADWRLSLWLFHHQKREFAWFEGHLRFMGLWKPAWSEPDSGRLDGIGVPPRRTQISCELKRVASREWSPFFFASAPTPPRALSKASGRFDLFDSTKEGSMYTAMDGVGACREVFDRELIVTLRDVLNKRMWSLKPQAPLHVIDLTAESVELAGSDNRISTQAVAMRLRAGVAGIMAGLKTKSDSHGVVLFGRAGPTLPGATGLGRWRVKQTNLCIDPDFWIYLNERSQRAGSSIMLRRFPEDLAVRKR